MLTQILVAMGCCLLSFGVSHIFWLRRKKKEGNQAIPMFWERPFIALMSLMLVCKITDWSGDIFAAWMMGWYVFFLIFYTWYLYRTYPHNHPPTPSKENVQS